MDRDDDVERLFSWIKTPDLHYREFAADREVADAAATWPALRDAVPEPSPADKRLQPEPYDDELLPAERARHADHAAALFGHHELGRHEPPPPAYHRAAPPAPHEDEAAREVPWAAEPPQAAPIFAPREPAPPLRPPRAYEPPPSPPVFAEREPPRPLEPRRAQEPPAVEEFRGFEEAQEALPAAEPAPKDEPRSLDAIFSRVAHPGGAPRDGRRQPSAGPGLGPVFRRLR
jgi:hypothetical protein